MPPRTLKPQTLKIVCALSILLNIFLLAGVGSSLFWLHQRRPVMGAGAMRIVGAELPEGERKAFRQTLRAARAEARPLAQTDRQARQDAARLLRAPSVDQAALGAALARVRDADMAIRAHVEGRAIPFVAGLSQTDRDKLAEGVELRGRLRAR
jgi:uncharacterized membrane protein